MERLSNPIQLECGAVIDEWSGSEIDVERVQNMCSIALSAFKKRHNIKQKEFKYSISLISKGSSFRQLNDNFFRFSSEINTSDVTGYTLPGRNRLFSISNTEDEDFDVSFMHELYHAMSHHYNTFTSLEEDELLAQKFTSELGYGK